MATDTKNDSAPPEASPTIAAGAGGKRHPGSYKQEFKRLGRQAFVLIAVLILLAGLGVLLRDVFNIGQKVYAQAAGHKIYKKDVKAVINGQKGVSDHQAATVLADKYLTEAIAKSEKITVTDNDIQKINGPNAKKLKSTDPYAYQLGVNRLYFDRLQAYNRGIYKGKVLVAHFSRFIPARPVKDRDKAKFPQFGDPAAIAQDKKYAQDFINELYNQVRSNKITWDQAIQTEHNDPGVGEKAYPALSHSRSFDTSQLPESLFVATSALDQVRKIEPGQTSKPFVVLVETSNGPPVESYFLIVRMDSKKGGQTVSVDKYLTQMKKRLGYKVNV